MNQRDSFHNSCYFIILALCSLSLSATVSAQPPLTSAQRYSFLQLEHNVLNNEAYLEPVFEKLYHLKTTQRQHVNFIHIGDSHIQADFLTEVVRKKLQSEFGNAGRGLIVPGRVAGTNEPFNFRSSAMGKWNAKRIIHTSNPMPIGIGGITIQSDDELSGFSIKMTDPQIDYGFNRVSVFHKSGHLALGFSLSDSLGNEITRTVSDGAERGLDYTRFTLPNHTAFVQINALRENPEQNHLTIFGLSLENGANGIMYHAIGVNGAKYEHYNRADLFARQANLLQPDLFLISLGTNESVEYPVLNKDFIRQISALVTALTGQNPDARFVLITPPDAFIKKNKINPGIEIVRNQIIQYAVENGIAFWDMFKVNGGRNSAKDWKESGLLRPDGIHFTREGYALQGHLLFEAIMKSYNKYVADRHP